VSERDVYLLNKYVSPIISGGKGGAMRLQSYLILRVIHRILFFTIEILFTIQ